MTKKTLPLINKLCKLSLAFLAAQLPLAAMAEDSIVPADQTYGSLHITWQAAADANWKWDESLQWLYFFEYPADDESPSFWFYSWNLGWMWHHTQWGSWFYAQGLPQTQWAPKDTFAALTRGQPIIVPRNSSSPSSHPFNLIDYAIRSTADGTKYLDAIIAHFSSQRQPHVTLQVEEFISTRGSLPRGRAFLSLAYKDQPDPNTPQQTTFSFDLSSLAKVWNFDLSQDFELNIDRIAIENFSLATFNHDYARIAFDSNVPGTASIRWGLSPDALEHSANFGSEAKEKTHLIDIFDLPSDAEVFVQPQLLTEIGILLEGEIQSFTTSAVAMLSEVSSHGITWTFDKPYPAGQFINGDWWVVGPVEIIAIDPAPGPIPAEEAITDKITGNQFGDTTLQDNLLWKNGSMIVRAPENRQAYDSRNNNYYPPYRFRLPAPLNAGQSLVSTISHTPESGYPTQVMHHAMMWPAEKIDYRVLKTAAVLTVLDSVPAGDAFRPAYVEPESGSSKEIFHAREVRWEKLLRLPAVSDMASWSQYERYLERPWLDHIRGDWADQRFVPSENQVYYGREYARIGGIVSLLLHLDVPRATKITLLHRYLQLGIDLRGLALRGSTWNEGGGLTSGRKWAVLFAGLMLNENYTYDLPETVVFHEDTQTYWGRGWHNQRALYQMVWHHGPRMQFQHLTPDQYSNWDWALGKAWGTQSENYRTNTTVRAWPGQALAALLMNAKRLWNHDVYFEVVDDWMRLEDLYAPFRGEFANYRELKSETTAFDPFVTSMWRAYRDSEHVPPQPDTDTHRWWNPFIDGFNPATLKWEPNEKPEDIGPEVYANP